jgi:predicted CopG family antitoxin
MFKHTKRGGSLVKTITIRDEVYEKLSAAKGGDESFSELLGRLVEGVDSMKILRELRGTVEFESGEKEKLLAEIRARRAERRP